MGFGFEGRCEAGCKIFTGGEVKHYKDCVHYPDSLSKMYDELEAKEQKHVVNAIAVTKKRFKLKK